MAEQTMGLIPWMEIQGEKLSANDPIFKSGMTPPSEWKEGLRFPEKSGMGLFQVI